MWAAMPSIDSTDGRGSLLSLSRMEERRASTQRLCPSARMVSMASDDFPEPEGPQKTTTSCRGLLIGVFADCFDVHCTM